MSTRESIRNGFEWLGFIGRIMKPILYIPTQLMKSAAKPFIIFAAVMWVITSLFLGVIGDIAVYIGTGHTTGFNFLRRLLLPWQFFRDPLHGNTAYEPWDEHSNLLIPVLSILLILTIAGWVWAIRHGKLNPFNTQRRQAEMGLTDRLRVDVRNVGILMRAGDENWRDKFIAFLRRNSYYLNKHWKPKRRADGQLVPVDKIQPDDMGLLCEVDSMGWFKRKHYYAYAGAEHHVLIYGPSGTGKGVSQIGTQVLGFGGKYLEGWRGPLIVTSTKADLLSISLEWRSRLAKSAGHDQCLVYEVTGAHESLYKGRRVHWNPLPDIRNYDDANTMTETLYTSYLTAKGSSATSGGGNSDYFRDQGMGILLPLIYAGSLIEDKSLARVYTWSMRLKDELQAIHAAMGQLAGLSTQVSSPDSQMKAVIASLAPCLKEIYDVIEKRMEELLEEGNTAELLRVEQVLDKVNDMRSKDPREGSGIWGTVQNILAPFSRPIVQDATNPVKELDIEKFLTTPYATLYVIAPTEPAIARTVQAINAAFVQNLMERCFSVAKQFEDERLPYPVQVVYDEAKAFGAVGDLSRYLATIRSYNVVIRHAWQDDAQIDSAYGKDDAKTVVSNSRTRVILPEAADVSFLHDMSELIGEEVQNRVSKTVNVGDQGHKSEQHSLGTEKAGKPADIRTIPDGHVLVLTGNKKAFVGKQVRYFEDRHMKARLSENFKVDSNTSENG